MKKLFAAAALSLLLTGNAYAKLAEGQRPLDKWATGNLIQNPGAEAENVDGKIPHWQPLLKVDTWNDMNDQYGHTSGEWEWDCNEACGLPPHAGKRYFRLPTDDPNPLNGLTQAIVLPPAPKNIPQQELYFNLSGYMTGFICEKPGCGRGTLAVVFYDAAGKELNKFETTRDSHDFQLVDPNDSRKFKFVPVDVAQPLPAGAARATVTMRADAICCNGAYIFFDNLSLVVFRKKEK